MKSSADISVTIDKNWKSYWRKRYPDPQLDAETLKLDSEGYITQIGQKPKSLDEIEGQYMGLMKFSNVGLRQIKEVFYKALNDDKILTKPINNAYITDLLQAVINSGKKIQSVL